jgi:hypothetical protein
VRVDAIRDQGEKYTGQPMSSHHRDRVFHFCLGDDFGLEVDSAEAVHLKIEEARGG